MICLSIYTMDYVNGLRKTHLRGAKARLQVLLSLFAMGVSDKEMAKKLGVTEATIRRQRFTFREKAKRAKLYLAIYEQVFEAKPTTDNAIIPIHNSAKKANSIAKKK